MAPGFASGSPRRTSSPTSGRRSSDEPGTAITALRPSRRRFAPRVEGRIVLVGPVVDESGVDRRDHRTGHAQVRVAPLAGMCRVAVPSAMPTPPVNATAASHTMILRCVRWLTVPISGTPSPVSGRNHRTSRPAAVLDRDATGVINAMTAGMSPCTPRSRVAAHARSPVEVCPSDTAGTPSTCLSTHPPVTTPPRPMS